MEAKRMFYVVLAMILLLAITAGPGWTQEGTSQEAATGQSLVGTAFTYQGQLSDGGSPANGSYDLNFRLLDSGSGGSQVGTRIERKNRTIQDGLFTEVLDFGSGVFNGDARWLEVGVRPGGSSVPYEILELQPLTAAPYAQFADTIYRRTVVVKPVGTPVENGVALRAALAAVVDAAETNPYLLKIEPGLYNLGTNRLEMKEYVDIEGSGVETTEILSRGSARPDTGTVIGADNAELRFLTVHNDGPGAAYAKAIYNPGVSPRLSHIRLVAERAHTAIGAHSLTMSHPIMEDVEARAEGTEVGYGLHNVDSYPAMRRTTAISSGATKSFGVYNEGCFAEISMVDVEAIATGVEAVHGVYNVGSNPTMIGVVAEAWRGESNHGLLNDDSSPTMDNVVALAMNGDNNHGLTNRNGSSPTMNGVTVTAGGGAHAYGFVNQDSEVQMNNVVTTGSGASVQTTGVWNNNARVTMINVTATGRDGKNNTGIRAIGSDLTLIGSTAMASGAATLNLALDNFESSLVINNSTLSALGAVENVGLQNGGTTGTAYSIYVNNSQIVSEHTSPDPDPTIRITYGFMPTRLGASQLSGDDVVNSVVAVLECVGVYDENYAALSSACN